MNFKMALLSTLVLLLCSTFTGRAEDNRTAAKIVERTQINYHAFEVAGNRLFAINDSGRLVIWDMQRCDTVANNIGNLYCWAIAKDRHGNIYVGTTKGDIYRIDTGTLAVSLFRHIKYSIYQMCFNSDNELFVVVGGAVLQPATGRHWHKFQNHTTGLKTYRRYFHRYERRIHKFLALPNHVYLDDKDRWWMYAAYGEFGGELQVFDTKHRRIYDNHFDSMNMGSMFPQSVFGDTSGNIYVTSGMSHFYSHGEVYRIAANRSVTKLHSSYDSTRTLESGQVIDGGLFIGPGAYHKADNSLYLASSDGFFKAALLADGSMGNLQWLFDVKMTYSREPLSMGYQLSVQQMTFLPDGRLLFMTKSDGFGLYDGKSVVMLK